MDNNTKFNNRLNVYLMYLIIFFQGFVFYGPVATLYRQGRGISMYQIFLIESVFWILMIVFEIPWGWFADRFGYKKTLIISNLLFLISKIVFYKALSFEMFLFERILLAMAISGLTGCDTALIYGSIEENESQKVFGRYDALAAAGYIIASLMSTIIVKYSIYLTAFYTIFPYVIALILTLFIKDIPVNNKEKSKLRNSFTNAFSKMEIIILVISISLFREVFQAINVFLNQLQYIRSGIDIKYFGILMVIIQIACLSSTKSHKLSKKIGNNRSIEILMLLIIICCFLLIFTQSPFLSVLLIILVAGSISLINPIVLEIQNKSIITGDRATILSMYAMAGDIVAAAINPVIGKAADISLQTSFITCVIISVIGYIFFLIYKRKINFALKLELKYKK